MLKEKYPHNGVMLFPQYFDTVLPSAFLNAGVAALEVFYPAYEIANAKQAFENTCIPVRYPTPYSIWTLGDYKRCVEANNIYCASNSCP